MRFFTMASGEYFRKPVHERIKLKEGASIGTLRGALCVPTDPSLRNGWKKDGYYVAIDVERSKSVSIGELLRGTLKTIAISGLYLVRLVRIQLFCRGKKMPLGAELLRHTYHVRLIWGQWRARVR
jgi:hypothetical protein